MVIVVGEFIASKFTVTLRVTENQNFDLKHLCVL